MKSLVASGLIKSPIELLVVLSPVGSLTARVCGVPESRLVLGKHSGRHALKARCDELGIKLDREQLDHLYREFTALADRKKGILDEEIRELALRINAQSADRKIA